MIQRIIEKADVKHPVDADNEIIQKNNLRFMSEREYVSEDLVFDFDYYPLAQGVCVSDRTDYYYCDNAGSLTTKYKKDRFENQIKLYEFLVSKAKKLGIEVKNISLQKIWKVNQR